MRAFADLLDRLIYTRSRNAKLKLIVDYLRATPDPDRGWAMAALTGELDLPGVKPAVIRALIEARVDPVLYRMSRDYVGDSAETIALLWPTPPFTRDTEPLSIAQAVDRLSALSRSDTPAVLAGMLDRLDADERFALLKMATGALRIGVSSRLAKTALAQAFDLDVEAVEEVWHGIDAPYTALFDWAQGRGAQPTAADVPVFRPFMLAHPLEDLRVDLADYAAEWKWDGIRVQIVHVAGQTRLFSRTGDDITASFPEVARDFTTYGVVDGELMVKGDAQGTATEEGGAASFNALQQRLGRKVVSAKVLAEAPAFVRLYDILFDGAEDLRGLPWSDRRARLESFAGALDPGRFDLSMVIVAEDFTALESIRAGARDAAIEGVMLKRRDSPYVGGRKTGLWYKWKRDPLTADCVMMYAQRGITLPAPRAAMANYVGFVRTGNLLFVSGQVCADAEGKLIAKGKLGAGVTIEQGYHAAKGCGVNLLAQVKAALGDLDKVVRVVRLGGFINSAPDFLDGPKVLNGTSDLMVEAFGDKGRHARTTVGVASLPSDAAVEVDGIFEVS